MASRCVAGWSAAISLSAAQVLNECVARGDYPKFIYWYQRDRHETNVYGEPVPVRRSGNLLYAYELAREQLPA